MIHLEYDNRIYLYIFLNGAQRKTIIFNMTIKNFLEG